MPAKLVRRAAYLLGGSLVVASIAIDARQLSGAVGSFAPDGGVDFFSPTMCAALLRMLGVLGLTVAAAPWITRRLRATEIEREISRPAFLFGSSTLVAALATQAVATIHVDPPLTRDGTSYQAEALEVQGAGGAAALPARLWRGEEQLANRHPLFLGALATFAEPSPRFAYRARLLVALGGALACALLIAVASQSYGRGAGLLVGSLAVSTGAFVDSSATIACETWLLVFLLAWWLLLSRPISEASRARLVARGAACGVCAALAWLTKGTGLLALPATVAFGVVTWRRRALLPVAAAVAAFAVVASPLLVRNARVFDDPFFNFNSSQVFWLDEWQHVYDVDRVALAGPGDWLERHAATPVADAAQRLAVGAVKVAPLLVQSSSPGPPRRGLFDAAKPFHSGALGVAVLLLACAGWTLRSRSFSRRAAALVIVPYLSGLAWYAQLVTGERFTLLASVFLIVPAGAAAARLTGRVGPAIAAALATTLLVASVPSARDTPSFETHPARPEIERFLEAHLSEWRGAHYLLGPTHQLHLDWNPEVAAMRHAWPRRFADVEALDGLPWGDRLVAAIVERSTVERAEVPFAAWDDERGLEVTQEAPPGWRLALAWPEERPEVLAFLIE